MRNPARIRPLLERLERIWTGHSDLRLGQLIINGSNGTSYASPFYMEDELLMENLEKLFLYTEPKVE